MGEATEDLCVRSIRNHERERWGGQPGEGMEPCLLSGMRSKQFGRMALAAATARDQINRQHLSVVKMVLTDFMQ